MAKRGMGGSGLNMTARLDTSSAIKNAQDYIKVLNEIKAASGISPNTTPSANFTQANIKMTKALRDSMLETERLRQENVNLQNQWQKGAISLQDLTLKQKTNTAARQAEVRAAKEARKAQEEVNGSYFSAQARLKALGTEIKSEADGMRKLTPALKSKVREYNELNVALTKFDEKLGNHQRKVGKYENALNGLKGLTATYLGGAAILGAGNQVIQSNADISDSLSDVRRTAGLTAVEAENLAEQLKKLDTRTSLKGLLDIATIGGQLGIAKDQLGGFTAAVDQLAVSLSGELEGGAEGIAKSLGVLDNVFGVTKSNAGDVEKSFNQIGSAILGLGQSGLATGDFLTDFGERVGGLAKQAGISLPVILSYGAVLQENGVSAEVAGTSFKRLISALSTNREKFFAVAQLADANLTMKGFTDTINTDTKKALDLFFAGLQKGGPTTTSFNDILKSLKLTGAGVSQTVAALSGHQESLNSHIQQATKDFDQASLSAEQFALKNDNLAGSLEKFDNTVTKITTGGRITAMFKGIVDGATNALDKFNNLVNSESWREFWTRLNNSNGIGDDISNFTKSFGTVSKNNNANQQFIFGNGAFDPDKLKNLGAASFNQYLGNVKKTYDTALDTYANYAAAVQSGRIKEQKVTVDQYKFQSERAKSYYTQLLDLQNKFGYGPKAIEKKKVTDTVTPVDVVSDKEKRAADAALEGQRKLQARIDELNDKGKRKQLDDDAQEIEQIKAKYAKLRDEADRFNNNQKNKSRGLRVDAGGLLRSESTETDVAVDRQATAKLKVTLDAQAKLFDEYESYKSKVGSEKANERYAGQLDTDKTYLQKLQQMEDDIINPQKSKGGDSDGVRNELQLKLLRERIEIEKVEQRKKDDEIYADAYRSALTHSQNLALIDADYNRKRAALGASATAEQLTNLNRERDERKMAANEANAYAESGYNDLMMQYNELTREAILKRLADIKEGYRNEFKEGKLTAEQLAGFISQINGEIDNLNGSNVFNKITEAVKRYKDAVSDANGALDTMAVKQAKLDMVSAIGDGADGAAKIVDTLAASFAQLGIGTDQLQADLKNISGILSGGGEIAKGIATGNPVDIITGSIKLLTNAIELFNFKDKKLAKQIKEYQAQLDSLGKAYKQLERDVANSVGESIYTDQAAQIENLKRQQGELEKMRDAERNKKKTDQGKVAEYQSQIDSIPGQIQDIERVISQTLIQGTFKDLSNSLADAFSEAFKAGEDGIAKMDDVFDGFIANAIKNSLKLKILDPVVKNFTDQLTDYAKNNNNSIVGFDFDKWREQLKEAGELFNAGLKGSEEFFKDIVDPVSDAPKTGISGAIVGEALKEDTANRMLGLQQGVYDLTKQNGLTMGEMLQIGRQKLAALEKIANNTLRGADNTDGHTEILNKIATNTTPKTEPADPLGQAIRNAGLGI